ncbi:conserved hypothetical protein, partial [Ricinus communis]
MPLRDRLDDRETEPAALRVAAGHAIKAVEHALAFRRRNARPAVFHGHGHAAVFRHHRHVDRAALRRVLDRIVDEVAEQDHQRVRLPFHVGAVRPLQAE